jgi:predicted NBD/HSP70 family sugar kinase
MGELHPAGIGADRRGAGALAVLRLVHERPGISRSQVAEALGLGTSSTTEITARLRALDLVTEHAPVQAGRRGRPSGLLLAHPSGPVVLAVEIAHPGWRVAAVELGGRVVETAVGRRSSAPAATLADVRRGLTGLHRAFDGRVAGIGVSVTGTVSGTRLLQAATFRWGEVDLRALVPRALRGLPFAAGNDATLAGLAEARRGAAAGAGVVLYLAVEVGIGGVLVVDGQPLTGAQGEGGEFGHMPFGSPGLRCPCGATGCWDLEVDGRALARLLGRRAPTDPRGYAARVLAAADAGSAEETAAVRTVAAALGRGTGALVNALDPELVVYGGLAPGIHRVARPALETAFHDALMKHRRAQPPPIAASALGDDASLLGAAEQAFDLVLTPRLLLP